MRLWFSKWQLPYGEKPTKNLAGYMHSVCCGNWQGMERWISSHDGSKENPFRSVSECIVYTSYLVWLRNLITKPWHKETGLLFAHQIPAESWLINDFSVKLIWCFLYAWQRTAILGQVTKETLEYRMRCSPFLEGDKRCGRDLVN